jgi:hypothetical protein
VAAFIDGLTGEQAARIDREYGGMSREEKIRLLESPQSSAISPERRYLMTLGMSDPDAGVRRAATMFLNWAGNAPDLLPYLLKFLRLETDAMVKGRIVFSLCNYPSDPHAAEAVVEVLRTDEDAVAEWVYRHMETWASGAHWGLLPREIWVAAVERRPLPRELRGRLARGLRQAAHVADVALPALRELAEDESFEVREAAAETLRAFR